MVDGAARKSDGKLFLSASLDHAAVIVQRMIADAQKSISVLSGNPNRRVYGSERVLESTHDFLIEDGHRMRVLLEEENESYHRGHEFLVRFKNDPRLEVRLVSANAMSRYKFHFMIADDDTYKFEPYKTRFSAIVAFGNSKGASRLIEVFELHWHRHTSRTRPCLSGDHQCQPHRLNDGITLADLWVSRSNDACCRIRSLETSRFWKEAWHYVPRANSGKCT